MAKERDTKELPKSAEQPKERKARGSAGKASGAKSGVEKGARAAPRKPAERQSAGDRERRVRDRAYELWEQEGRPSGRERDHWERAEREN